MKKLILLMATGVALMSAGAWADGVKMTPEQVAAARHANPMPNLIKVVGENQEKLKLTEKQKKSLARWVDVNKPRMMKKIAAVGKLEKQLHDAALAGAPGRVLKQIAERLFAVRGSIIKQKLACRNNLARILTRKQMQQTIELYKKG